MLLGHDVVADREAKPGPLAGRLGREERLEQFVFDLGKDTDAVVADADLHCLAEIARGHLQRRLETPVVSLLLAFGGGIKSVAEEVETDPADVLRHKFNRGDRVGIIALQCDVETLILGAGAVIGEVQRFLDRSVEIDAPAFATAAPGMLQQNQRNSWGR